jgi:uncharacterized RmlC-like cupin family protein
MQITRNSLETVRGPADRSTGDIYIDTIASPSGPSGLVAAVVHITPGARTTSHTHPHGQTIWVSPLCASARQGPQRQLRVAGGAPWGALIRTSCKSDGFCAGEFEHPTG